MHADTVQPATACVEQKSDRRYGTIGSCVPLGMSPAKPGSGLGFDLVASGVVLASGCQWWTVHGDFPLVLTVTELWDCFTATPDFSAQLELILGALSTARDCFLP
jgi:hypothetical protein